MGVPLSVSADIQQFEKLGEIVISLSVGSVVIVYYRAGLLTDNAVSLFILKNAMTMCYFRCVLSP